MGGNAVNTTVAQGCKREVFRTTATAVDPVDTAVGSSAVEQKRIASNAGRYGLDDAQDQ